MFKKHLSSLITLSCIATLSTHATLFENISKKPVVLGFNQAPGHDAIKRNIQAQNPFILEPGQSVEQDVYSCTVGHSDYPTKTTAEDGSTKWEDRKDFMSAMANEPLIPLEQKRVTFQITGLTLGTRITFNNHDNWHRNDPTLPDWTQRLIKYATSLVRR